MTEHTLFRDCAAIVTMDDAGTIHRNKDLLVSGKSVAQIGEGIVAPAGAEIVDATGWFVYPGLINTHHHFFQCFIRNNAHLDWTKLSVIEWLDLIYPIFSKLDEECFYHSSVVGMGELIKSGCTTAFDHQYNFPRHAGKNIVDRQFEAAQFLGMRFHAGRGGNTLPKSEGSTIPDEMRETTDEFISDCERLIDSYHDASEFSMAQVAVAPCQPVNCYRETFVESVALARDKGVLMHSHVGEGESEVIKARYGMRTVDWCEELGFAGPDAWYAHCWELASDEIAKMAASGTGVAHCPEPVYLVGAEVTPIPEMAARGVRISLGADGAASNDNSNLMHCIHSGYMLQALVANTRQHPVPTPAEFLRYATRGGADVLNRNDLGSLEVGKAADLFAIDTRAVEYVGTRHDPASFFAKVGHFRPVDLTMINGRVVWRDGEFPGLDEQRLAAQAEAHVERVVYS
ncbi:amidohydrolase [Qingshengfaniella alkalisoli]|uniref:Amidohydrolase n=1 Tax=Qingshengfaniella alkalisoli TaxID=2599296 RepID=A0A5B8J1L8_9RHOB|nr:amidohydrolase [Qingshengfaniella alkalisoli]QDY71071.1 amidohydrolase [Qingshengfaniella alkalisoli]